MSWDAISTPSPRTVSSWDDVSSAKGPRDFGIDWNRPHDAVRADIAQLGDSDRAEALRQWSDAAVAKERAGGGIGMAIDNTVRTLARGTFVGPFLDEATAATQKGLQVISGGALGSDYDEALAYQRARDRAVDKDYPVLSTVGQLATGIGTGIAAGRAASGAVGMATGGPVAMMAPAATATGRIGQGAAIGGLYGGVHGFGNGEGWQRAEGAASGVLGGAVAGTALSGLAEGAGRVAQGVATSRAAARAETDDATSGSLMAVRRALDRDRITPDDIIAQIREEMPDSSATAGMGRRFWGSATNRQAWTDDQIELVVRAAETGRSADDIAAIMARVSPNRTAPSPAAVTRILDEYADRTRGPLNLVDRASLVRPGSGDNTQMTLRAAAATPGEAKAIARENLVERQIGAGGRIGDAFENAIGSRDFDGVSTRFADALRTAEDQAYALARNNETAFDLNPIFTRWSQSANGRRGPVPEAVAEAIAGMQRQVPVRNQVTGMPVTNQLVPPRTLQEFIDARQNLSGAIDAAGRKYGMGSGVTRALIRMRNELSDEVRRTNPAWGHANDIARDGRAAQDMLDAGSRMATRLNASTRESMADFAAVQTRYAAAQRDLRAAQRAARANPQQAAQHAATQQAARIRMDAAETQMELFRVGLVRALNDKIANAAETSNLTRTLQLPAARQMLRTVLGDQRAAQLMRAIDAEQAMHRTYSSQFGSQTTPLKEAVDDLNWAPRMSSWIDLANPRKALEAAGEFASSRINADRNRRMVPLLTDTDRVRQLRMMRTLRHVEDARNAAGRTVQLPALYGAAGVGAQIGGMAGPPQFDRRR